MKTSRFFSMVVSVLLILPACKKEYSYERGPADFFATGYLQKSSGSCAPVRINGQYKAGIVLVDSNYITVPVHFTSPGRYKISTDIQNGFSFYDSAVVTDTGYKEIKLRASGKPIKAENTNFSVTFDTSICSFSVSLATPPVQTPSPTTPDINQSDSAWQFTVGNLSSRGFFDGALTHVLNGATIITLVGLTPTKDSAIAIIINMAGVPIFTGSYKSPVGATFIFFGSSGTDIFTADKALPGVELSVVITKYDPATRILEGSFSGTVLNGTNTAVPLTAGKFKAQLNN